MKAAKKKASVVHPTQPTESGARATLAHHPDTLEALERVWDHVLDLEYAVHDLYEAMGKIVVPMREAADRKGDPSHG